MLCSHLYHVDSILCISVEFVELFFQSSNLAAMFVRRTSCRATPFLYHAPALRLHDLKERNVLYFMRARLLRLVRLC